MNFDVDCISKENCSSTSGFSLIEVALLITIIGLLSVPAIQIYNLERKDAVVAETTSSLSYVRDSLSKFAVENGRYPVPAVRNLSVDNVNAGVEFAGAIIGCAGAGGETNPCSAGGAIIGDIPFKALGVNPDHIVDGYGGKLTYAVTNILTNVGTFNENGGVITVSLRNNSIVPSSPESANNAHFVIVSHGKDNAGAFSFYGTYMNACPSGGATNRDTINCNHADSVFTTNADVSPVSGVDERFQYSAVGANHYDDYTYFSTTTSGSIWSYSVGAPDMNSRYPGNALIGFLPNAAITGGGPRPNLAVAKLEVVGDVAVDILTADRLCVTHNNAKTTSLTSSCPTGVVNGALVAGDPYDENVFDPSIISVGTTQVLNHGLTGGGIRCKDSALTGIGNSDEECSGSFPSGFVGTFANCPAGQYPKGIRADGELDCIIP